MAKLDLVFCNAQVRSCVLVVSIFGSDYTLSEVGMTVPGVARREFCPLIFNVECSVIHERIFTGTFED